MKIFQLSLEELYSRPRITPSVENAILLKEDFSNTGGSYCEKVCKLKCKSPEKVRIHSNPCDVLIIQDTPSPDGKFDRLKGQQEQIQQKILAFVAAKAGFAGLTFKVVNLLKCPLDPIDLVKGKPPTSTVLGKCKPFLWEEIRRCKPKVIISLGTATTKALGFKNLSNGGNRGNITSLSKGTLHGMLPDIPVVLSAHPRILSMIRQNAQGSGMWGADYFNIIQLDFAKAAAIARGAKLKDIHETIKYYRENRIIFCKSVEDVEMMMEKLKSLPESSVVSFDIESNTLDPYQKDAKLLTIQFGYRDPETGLVMAFVVPLNHRKNDFYEASEVWPMIHDFLVGPQPKVGHNGKFDILMIYWTMGTRVANYAFDTMLLLHSISSGNQGCYGLKAATWDYLWDLGFAGYEDLLPSLNKIDIDSDSEENESSTTGDSNV